MTAIRPENQPEHGSIKDILATRGPFLVPRYQRGYEWDDEQIQKFIKDISGLLSAHSTKTHFFGTLITVLRQTSAEGSGFEREIVDGQQRLTTFSLAFLTIRDTFVRLAAEAEEAKQTGLKKFCEEQADELTKSLLLHQHTIFGQPAISRPRIQLSRQDHSFYSQTLVTGGSAPEPTRPSHQRIVAALSSLQAGLLDPIMEAGSVEQRANGVFNLSNAMRDRCTLVLFSGASWRVGAHFFSVLNDRGKPLNAADLLRTRTLELVEAGSSFVDDAEADWSAIQERPGKKVVGFLRTYYGSLTGDRPPRNGFFDELVDTLLSDESGTSEAQALRTFQIVRGLRDAAKLCWTIEKGDWPYEDGNATSWQRDRLRRLVVEIGHRQSVPLLLAARTALNESKFVELVRWLELTVFRYVICSGHNSVLGDLLLEHAHRVRAEGDVYDIRGLLEELRVLVLRYAPDSIFRVQLRQRLNYKKSTARKLVRHFLTTVEQFKKPTTNVWELGEWEDSSVFDLGHLDIEHIYPQSPSLRIPSLDPRVHSLGNLSFWGPTDNERASNAPFVVKKQLYAKSEIGLNNEIAMLDNWTPDLMTKREDSLVERALLAWPVPGGSVATAADNSPPLVWLVRATPGGATEGIGSGIVEFPSRGRAAKGIAEGGVILYHHRPSGRDSVAACLGVGVVASVDPRDNTDAVRIARLSRFEACQPPIPLGDLGVDTESARVAVVPGNPEVMVAVLQRLGRGSQRDLPELVLPVTSSVAENANDDEAELDDEEDDD